MQALRQLRESAPKFIPRPQGKTVGFLSAKGGCGASTILCHVAAELVRGRDAVALLDLDFNGGLVSFLMKSSPAYSLTEVNGPGRLDLPSWKTCASHPPPGADIFAGSGSMGPPKVSQVRRVLAFVEARYNWALIDLGRGLNSFVAAVLREIGEVYLITTLDVPAMHQAKCIVRTLLEGGYQQDRIRLVVNRTPERLDVTPVELARCIGVPIDCFISNDYPDLYYAYSEGELLDRNTQLGKQLSRFAARLSARY